MAGALRYRPTQAFQDLPRMSPQGIDALYQRSERLHQPILFPGYYSGQQGQGAQMRLDPRFQVSDQGAGQTAYEGLLGLATRPYQAPQGLLQSALDEYGDTQKSQMQSLAQALRGRGRGLRAGDAQRLQERQQEQALLGQAQIRSRFDQLGAADQLRQAQTQEGLLGMLPGLANQAMAAKDANANRLVDEAKKRSDYDQSRFRAVLKEAQIRDIGDAAQS